MSISSTTPGSAAAGEQTAQAGDEAAVRGRRGGKKPLSEGKKAERRLGWLLCAPAAFVMVAVTAYPILYSVWLSLLRYDLKFPDEREFIGLENYVTVLTNNYWWTAFGVTMLITVVSVIIGCTAWQIFRRSFHSLLDSVELDPRAVRAAALSLAGVVDCHAVRSRAAGGQVHVDLHIHVAPDMSVAAAHDLTHAVEEEIRRRFPSVADVIIHTEPVGAAEP